MSLEQIPGRFPSGWGTFLWGFTSQMASSARHQINPKEEAMFKPKINIQRRICTKKNTLQLHVNEGQRHCQETTQAQTCSLLRTNSLVAVRRF